MRRYVILHVAVVAILLTAHVFAQSKAKATNKPYSFNRPTDVGWDRDGNIFITDGYGDSRVVKYDKNGRVLKSAGTRGNQPGQLNLPHTSEITDWRVQKIVLRPQGTGTGGR